MQPLAVRHSLVFLVLLGYEIGRVTKSSLPRASSAFSVAGQRSGEAKLSFKVCQAHVFGTGAFGKEWKWINLRHVAFGSEAITVLAAACSI